jgi:hypothetical protein
MAGVYAGGVCTVLCVGVAVDGDRGSPASSQIQAAVSTLHGDCSSRRLRGQSVGLGWAGSGMLGKIACEVAVSPAAGVKGMFGWCLNLSNHFFNSL